MYLFFDTETNGLPKKFNGPASDLDNWPRIIQLAFIVVDKNWVEQASYCQLIKPDNWFIPSEKFWIDNGYSTVRNQLLGVSAQSALNALVYCIEQCTHVVAHNMAFDGPVIGAEMLRYGIKSNNKPKRVCTMQSSTQWCGLRKSNGGPKWPKLEELHMKLFSEGFVGAHDALADVNATVRCARRLEQMNLLSFD